MKDSRQIVIYQCNKPPQKNETSKKHYEREIDIIFDICLQVNMGALIFPAKGIRWGKKRIEWPYANLQTLFWQRDSGTFVSNDLENNRLLVINFVTLLGRELNTLIVLSTITEKFKSRTMSETQLLQYLI